MREIFVDELRQIQLDILKDVHIFCQNHNIKYSLCGGTLIGAIRHKGFIPWDDDIDIFMLRCDYNRFLKEYPETDKYEVCYFEKNNAYLFPFAKVQNKQTVLEEDIMYRHNLGVNIDVFPIDNIPERKKNQIYQYTEFYKKLILQKFFNKKYSRNFFNKCYHAIVQFILRPIPLSLIIKKLIKQATAYKEQNVEYCGCLVWGYGKKELQKKSNFDSYILTDFEDSKFYIIGGYDNYLRNTYGDYMILPPMEKRISHHYFKAYWK